MYPLRIAGKGKEIRLNGWYETLGQPSPVLLSPSEVGCEGGVSYGKSQALLEPVHTAGRHFPPLNPTARTQDNQDSAFISLLGHIPVHRDDRGSHCQPETSTNA